jgi:hypothetical protein
MLRSKTFLCSFVLLIVAQTILLMWSEHPELNWESVHYFLDWFFYAFYLLPLTIILPAGNGGTIEVGFLGIYMLVLPIMMIYSAVISAIIYGVTKLKRQKQIA